MFDVLVESAGQARTGVGPRVTSFVVHSGLIALAAAGVSRSEAQPSLKPVAHPIDIYVAPSRAAAGPSGGPSALPGPVLGPPPLVSVDPPASLPSITTPVASPVAGPTPQDLAGRQFIGGGAIPSDSAMRPVLLAGEVDEPVTVLVPARLVYPARLAATGVSGEVRLAFVVDTAGRCEPATVRVIASSDPGFEASARDAVCGATYRPGKVRGQPVRQLVQQKVAFRQP